MSAKSIYISASIINAPLNALVSKILKKNGHNIILPQLFCPPKVQHESFEESIYKQCIEGMEKCDVGLILLDSYERDSSWEAGWFAAKKKPLIGFVQNSLKFRQDWMIKGGINGIITTNEIIFTTIKKDNFFKKGKFIIKSKDIYSIGKVLFNWDKEYGI